jgi:hypothetical protein
MSICKYCDQKFDKKAIASHTHWCQKNPLRSTYIKNLEKARAAIKSTGNQFTKAKKEGKPIPEGTLKGKPGTFRGKKHTPESKEKMSRSALASPHRRLRRKMIEYNGVWLDSSWEVTLAKRLDELKIIWTRPAPLPWTDNEGKVRNYFADFYLPEYNLYLDPKNPKAKEVQKKKLEILLNDYKNLIILGSEQECENFVP